MKRSFSQIIYLFLILLFMLNLPVGGEEYFPLVVYGGEPEGVMAAITAAREGIKTLLIMERQEPGGLMTYGGLNYLDLNYGPDGGNLNQGLFAEWHQKVGNSIPFSIKQATEVFNMMLADESNLTVYSSAQLLSVNRKEGQLTDLLLEQNNSRQAISFAQIIDASQDGYLAAQAGVPHFVGGADIGLPERHMAVTLVLHLGNIDWQELAIDVKANRYGPSYINHDHAWGFVQIGQLYQAKNPNIKLRGLNIVIEGDGATKEVYINSMLIFNTDPLDRDELKRAYQWGQEEARHVLTFLQKNLRGFAEAELLPFPEELYVRESRHILTDYQLCVKDLFDNRIFADTIALSSYPLDYQASTREYNGFVLFNPYLYGIPLRSLIALNTDNLLVVGRSGGYSSLAAASARVLPTGMTAGEAAALASAISIKENIPVRDIVNNRQLIAAIQQKLGIDRLISQIDHKNRPLIEDQEVLPYLKELLSWGLVIGGYDNDFRLNAELTEREFAHLLVKGLKGREAPILYEWVPGGLESMSAEVPLSRDQAALLLLVAISKRVSELQPEEYYQTALNHDLIPDLFRELVPTDRLLQRKEAYILLTSFLQKYPLPAKLRLYRDEGE